MKRATFVRRSLRHYWRTHLGVVAGCAIATAVLAGALFVGDSVRESLLQLALQRLGRIVVAVDAGRRFFGDDLATRLGADAAAVLEVEGMAIAGEGDARTQVNRVHVLGVDDAFFRLADKPPTHALGRGDVALGARLAEALGVTAGDEVSLRLVIPDRLSRDAPLASARERDTARRRLRVAAVLDADALGRFSLRSDQTAPMNAFVDRAMLQRTLELNDQANRLVAAGLDADGARAAIRAQWTLADAGLAIRSVADTAQLESPRIYLDPAVANAALAIDGARGTLTYLVSGITATNGRSTPYSFVVGIGPHADGPVPEGMPDDGIVVNRWLADQLQVQPGGDVRMSYAELQPDGSFIERTRGFRVHRVVEMDALTDERELVPAFPGLTDVESCADWDVGITTDAKKLEDEPNEAYWKQYRTTPKAFVTLAAAQAMWRNRYGDLMAVRFDAKTASDRVSTTILERVDPAATGLLVRPARMEAIRAASESMDLGQLFLGMSVFLIAAALMLTAMLFVFSVDQRATERGVLLAIGHTPRWIRRTLLAEGAVLAAVGALAGVPIGWAFARALIGGLAHAWSGAVAGTAVRFFATPTSAAIAAVAGAVISIGAMAIALRRQPSRSVRAWIAGESGLDAPGIGRSAGTIAWVACVVGGTAAVAVAGWAVFAAPARPADAFFAAGAAMLVAGIGAIRIALAHRARNAASRTMGALGVRNAARRPGRSVTTAGMLAAGSFLVLAVASMKEDFAATEHDRASGTGGFELYGESSIAVHEDLGTAEGRDTYRLRAGELEGVSFTPLRVLDGDDASCLNLNQALTPPLIGVNPDVLARLGAFTGPGDAAALWKRLDAVRDDGAVPAIVGDSATAMWKLKMTVDPDDGATIPYTDERGDTFDVKLVGALPMRLTVLQGKLLVANRHFTERYPSESGARALLIDTPADRADAVRRYLTRRLDRVGLDVVPSVDRLRRYYVVESTYLTMFLVLGGLGLLLGTTGMGVLVLRNVLERRAELALLRAVGFSRRAVARVVIAEHRFLLVAGLAVGIVAAAIALVPAVTRPGVHIPFGLLTAFVVATAVCSLAWIAIAVRLALRAELVPALRDE